MKQDGKTGTAGKGALVGEGAAFTVGAVQDQNLIESKSGKYIARRFTPRECERLQGFPDGYTDIPYNGKEHAPDTHRYRALGNSFAVPVVKWIFERIQAVEDGR